MGLGHLDEPQDDQGGDGHAPLVFEPRPERDERFRKDRPAMRAIAFLADLADPRGQGRLDDLPVDSLSHAARPGSTSDAMPRAAKPDRASSVV